MTPDSPSPQNAIGARRGLRSRGSDSHWQNLVRCYFSSRPRSCEVCGDTDVELRRHTDAREGCEAISDVVCLCADHYVKLLRYHDKRKAKQSLTLSAQAFVRLRNPESQLVLVANPSEKPELVADLTIAERRQREWAQKREIEGSRRERRSRAKAQRGRSRQGCEGRAPTIDPAPPDAWKRQISSRKYSERQPNNLNK